MPFDFSPVVPVKPEVFPSLGHFIGWLEQQPYRRYSFCNPDRCLLAQYAEANGYPMKWHPIFPSGDSFTYRTRWLGRAVHLDHLKEIAVSARTTKDALAIARKSPR